MQTLPYQNADLPIAERVADLLSRMTLEEKVAQLYGMQPPENETGRFSPERAREHLRHGAAYINSFHQRRDTRATVEYINAVQRFLVEETRLGIPALGFGEALHGFMAHEATSFPQVLGLASTWDPALVEQAFTVAAREMRVRNVQLALTPVLDLAREPRWGRTEETYGEDAYLVARMGVAAVRGLQGAGPEDPEHVLATAKHFAAHGQPEGGENCAPANYAERILREHHLVPFQAVVEEAGVSMVMASYNEINGVPSHINPWLLGEVLREEWGFEGIVISDGWGVDDLYRLHHVAADAADAARQTFLAGVGMELGHCFQHLVDEVRAGRVPEAAIDAAVAQVLTFKFRLGLFEQPYVDPETAARVTNSAAHQDLARRVAEKALILLKNEGNFLPLKADGIRSLAVIGPNAAEVRLGGYSGNPGNSVSVLEGLRAKVGGRIEVRYAEGCHITEEATSPEMWWKDEVVLPDPEAEAARIAEAVKVAEGADVVLLVLGDNEQSCREGWSPEHLGDRETLDLFGAQGALLEAVVATGVPTVLLLINGRPVTLPEAAEAIPAILEGWYLGQATGTVVADALFGDVNPGGKLPITFPRSVGQLPAYYNHQPSARRGYLAAESSPRFPFGHGLSYTTFAYEQLHVTPERIPVGSEATVSVEVVNTGERAGDEVVQLYLRDVLSSLPRPVLELKGFQRITLEPGERRTVTFTVGSRELAFLGKGMQPVVEPGDFEIKVGGSSAQLETVVLEVMEE